MTTLHVVEREPLPRIDEAVPVIDVEGIGKDYALGGAVVRALRGITLRVRAGELLAVMGPSGSGKSTFMNLVGCLDRPTRGRYRLDGVEVSRMAPDELADVRGRKLGFVFQGFHLLPRASALGNVELPLVYAGVPAGERRARARAALESVGLGERAGHRPAELSGGQQQRVAIARALVNNPALILADEPTGNLDSRTSVEVMALLQGLNRRGITVVLVTHEPDIARYASRRVQFRDGLLVADQRVARPRDARAELHSMPSLEDMLDGSARSRNGSIAPPAQ